MAAESWLINPLLGLVIVCQAASQCLWWSASSNVCGHSCLTCCRLCGKCVVCATHNLQFVGVCVYVFLLCCVMVPSETLVVNVLTTY